MPTTDHSDFSLVAGDDWRIVGTPQTLIRFQTLLPVASENVHLPGWRPWPNQNMIPVDDGNCLSFRPHAGRLLQVAPAAGS